jgi:hypothetical protein
LFVNASVLDESGAPSRAPILLNFESPSQAEHHSTLEEDRSFTSAWAETLFWGSL